MRKPCCDKRHTNKGAWTAQEDEKLMDYIQTHGEGSWPTLPKAAGLHRCGKSCKLRWINYLRPDVKRGNFGEDEEDLIIKLHALLGNRWSLIAGRIPGRTDNEVKNYWNSHIKRKLISNGIDPNNHRIHQTLPPHPSNYITSPPSIYNSSHTPFNTFSDDNDGVSDAASFHEDEKSGSANLNLDLAIALLPDSDLPLVDEMPPQIKKVELSDEIGTDRCPTLLLFR